MAKGGLVTVEINEAALKAAATQEEKLLPLLESAAGIIADRANILGAPNPTQETVRWATGEHVGGTTPEYGSSAQMGAKGPVGLVTTKNYAAMKDNLENNTLLKAKG